MSPFAKLLRQFRLESGQTQAALAGRLGLERGYLASVEAACKAPPDKGLLVQLCAALGLSSIDAERLHRARERSVRKYLLRINASEEAYELTYELFAIVHDLPDSDLRMLRGLLKKFAPTTAPAVGTNPIEAQEVQSHLRNSKETPM
ncbi:helix-turn-helix domain-containing protein [Roseateles sp. L2-2]|uniref:helix-turn-helix domain-containing protein n=1 Tax=Roseateles sp. L2-2 TaxID=3422597 RepID=UPI003D35E91F